MEHSHHGTGMYTMTDCMHIFSRPIPIRYGGTGVSPGELSDLVLAGVSGIHGIMIRGITAVGILHIGMEASMPDIGEATGVVTGGLDGIRIMAIGHLEIGDILIYVRDVIRLLMVDLPVRRQDSEQVVRIHGHRPNGLHRTVETQLYVVPILAG